MSIVTIENLGFAYGKRKVLEGATFSLEGGATGLLGPNGAGKSTLLRILLGFLTPNAGSVSVLGFKLPNEALEVRQRLGYMPEREVTSPKVSAVSFLTYCGCLYGMTEADAMERAHEVLNYVGMGDNRYRKMETYSTGMLQRVKFAQALIHDPKVLLLDEPTNGLDPVGRIEMLELIKELAEKRGVTILLSSHLMPDIEFACQHVVMINHGKIVRHGEISELTATRENLYELRVRDQKEIFIARLQESGCACSEQQTGNVIVKTPDSFAQQGFFEAARACGTQVRHFRPVQASLEEVFMTAIRGN
jgi:ABC-2 type transport system ATP-binding protein